MLHCPNENEPAHPENANIRFFAEAIVEMGSDFLVEEFVQFLPVPANCGHCMALAFDDGVY